MSGFIEFDMVTPTGNVRTLINVGQIVRVADTKDGTYLKLTDGETIKIKNSYPDVRDDIYQETGML